MPPSRRGTTTIEQIAVLSILSVLSLITLASGVPLLEAAAVETATRDAASLFALARDHALSSGSRTALRIDGATQRILVHTGADTLAVVTMASRGVRLEATRDSMAYAPTGLGLGAANLRLVLTRGGRVDTITVSRLGRVQVH